MENTEQWSDVREGSGSVNDQILLITLEVQELSQKYDSLIEFLT